MYREGRRSSSGRIALWLLVPLACLSFLALAVSGFGVLLASGETGDYRDTEFASRISVVFIAALVVCAGLTSAAIVVGRRVCRR